VAVDDLLLIFIVELNSIAAGFIGMYSKEGGCKLKLSTEAANHYRHEIVAKLLTRTTLNFVRVLKTTSLFAITLITTLGERIDTDCRFLFLLMIEKENFISNKSN